MKKLYKRGSSCHLPPSFLLAKDLSRTTLVPVCLLLVNKDGLTSRAPDSISTCRLFLFSLAGIAFVEKANMWPKLFLLLALVPTFVQSLAATDEIQDADPAQSGYLDNHNMHPATVGSAVFGQLWKKFYGNTKEKWYAKPLVYTPPGGSQLVFLASTLNIIRTVNAVNGTLINERTVQPPFLQSDIGCTDIPDYIGIVVSIR
jgi:hypothetical protein